VLYLLYLYQNKTYKDKKYIKYTINKIKLPLSLPAAIPAPVTMLLLL
jgi:hypothetical protein